MNTKTKTEKTETVKAAETKAITLATITDCECTQEIKAAIIPLLPILSTITSGESLKRSLEGASVFISWLENKKVFRSASKASVSWSTKINKETEALASTEKMGNFLASYKKTCLLLSLANSLTRAKKSFE